MRERAGRDKKINNYNKLSVSAGTRPETGRAVRIDTERIHPLCVQTGTFIRVWGGSPLRLRKGASMGRLGGVGAEPNGNYNA